MKFLTIKLAVIFILIPFTLIFSWGDKGHKIINNNAIEILPKEMKAFEQWKDYITEHAADADSRKAIDKTEAVKHFIDIDYYKEFMNGNMIENKDTLISIYGDSIVTHTGTLPWATLETFENLEKAFKDKNRDRAMIYASDLGHYVADGHQPMHTVLNYNGQFTGQRGVHARYEIDMVDRHLDELQSFKNDCNVKNIDDPLDYIFNYIYASNSYCPVLMSADLIADSIAHSSSNDKYYDILWAKTKYVTEFEFVNAEQALASLIYTAWVDAGKPKFSEFN